jgi:hypothetical protein
VRAQGRSFTANTISSMSIHSHVGAGWQRGSLLVMPRGMNDRRYDRPVWMGPRTKGIECAVSTIHLSGFPYEPSQGLIMIRLSTFHTPGADQAALSAS